MKNKSVLFLMFLIFVSCEKKMAVLPFYDSPDFTPNWEYPDDDSFHKIRSFNLIDQKGKEFTEKNIDGKISVVDFFFTTCPGICPKMTNSMSSVANEFKDDNSIMILSHTVTPDKDTPSVLNDYANKKNIDYSHWKLVTGTRDEIYNLGRKYYFVEEDLGEEKTDEDFLHTENFILLDKNRRIRGIYNGLDNEAIIQLIADIKTLKKE